MNDNKIGNDHIAWIRNSQRLLDSLNIGYSLTDLNNVILEVNDTLLRKTGSKREDLIGKRLNDLFPEQDLEKLRTIDKRVGEFEDIDAFFQYDFFLRSPEGEIVPYLACISANFDEDGEPVTFNNLVSDISELKKVESALENEKKLLEAVLFGIGDCVTVFSVKGDVLIENLKGQKIRGDRKKPLLTLIHGNQKTINLKAGETVRSYDARIEAVHNDKGEVFAFVETLTDKTDQIQLEKQTHELNRMIRTMGRREVESVIIGKSPAIQKVFDLIMKCSEVDSNVLVLGETGVGKEVTARSIHQLSRRKEHPFVAINCGALPESLLESELFGHVKGAFTGAISDRPGLFREASGGTLFLDEIGDISPQMQVKLLRVLQEREIRPLGDSRKYAVDVRVITATNKDLDQLMRLGQFRMDLYYRIAVIPIIVPPLRDRTDDILLLARHFIEKYKKRNSGPSKNISHKAQKLLTGYRWPGNIRELENSVEYAMAMSRSDTLRSTDFPFYLSSLSTPEKQEGESGKQNATSSIDREDGAEPDEFRGQPKQSLVHFMEQQEKQGILLALKTYFGNRDLAAKSLGISRVSLWRKMKKHGLSGWKYPKESLN